MSLAQRLLATPSSWSPLFLRLALGPVMIGHGAQKLFGAWGGYGLRGTAGFFESIGLQPGLPMAVAAGGTELVGGALVLIGLATRLSALALAGVMAVAILTVHHSAFFASANGMEFPLTLLLVGLALTVSGGGAWSLDARLAARASSRS